MKHIRTYYIAILVLLFILYLHPTTSAYFFPFKRKILLANYLTKIQNDKSIIAQEFWQWRESYYPGSITFNKTVIEGGPHTIFRSTYITSYEYLVDSKTNQLGISVSKTEKGAEITFIKPISEMRSANGFFDYKDKDKKLLEDKFWKVYTVINN